MAKSPYTPEQKITVDDIAAMPQKEKTKGEKCLVRMAEKWYDI